jgi:cytosine/adenosine deaminase-related metal-dependent hydrolase
LSEAEEDLLVEHGAGVAHCPSSNFYVLSGVCAVRRLLDKGIKVGLGSDISGGTSAAAFGIHYAAQHLFLPQQGHVPTCSTRLGWPSSPPRYSVYVRTSHKESVLME